MTEIEATPGREESLRRSLDEPMPADLREQVGDLVEPHTINMYLKHGDVMSCIRVAFPVIRDYLRQHPDAAAPDPARSFALDPDGLLEITCPECDCMITISGRALFPGSTPDIGTDLGHEPTLGDLIDAASAHVCVDYEAVVEVPDAG
jgi:hypothetical protein